MITFKKKINGTIFLSDNKEKYEIVHPYFSFLEKEIPYDSHIFRENLDVGNIVVVSMMEEAYKIDFSKYLEQDEFIEKENKKQEEIKKESIKEIEKKEEIKVKKEKKEEIKKEKEKEKKEKEKNKVNLLKDSDILKKL
jgi:hypothetical protein